MDQDLVVRVQQGDQRAFEALAAAGIVARRVEGSSRLGCLPCQRNSASDAADEAALLALRLFKTMVTEEVESGVGC